MRRRLLHFCTLTLAGIGSSIASTNAVAEEFPLTVYAAEHSVIARGGPGDAYYATQELKRGQELIAYRLEKGEWYAVRPPEGSYSLVSATAVADQGDGYGEVVRDGAASRIGSTLNDLHDTVHVRLEQGERVRILGAQMKSGVKWLRIQPPRGEFRWVHEEDVSSSPPEPARMDGLDDPAPPRGLLPLAHNDGERYAPPPLASESPPGWEARPETLQPLPSTDAMRASTTPQPLAVSGQPAKSLSQNYKTSSPADGGGGLGINTKAPLAESRAAITPEPLKPTGEQPTPSAASSRGDESNLTESDAFERQLFVLEMELGRMVVEAPSLWDFRGLEQDASRLMARAGSEAEREAVRQFAGRLDRFAAIRRRHETLPGVDSLLAARGQGAATPLGTTTTNTIAQSVSDAANSSGNDSRFDAMGVLRPVASPRADAPKFALVNDSGQVVTFVTPAPDVNLQPYIGRRIGVSGTRGYMAEFNHRHVTAGRVMPVGDRLIR